MVIPAAAFCMLAQSPERPACGKENRGQIWPASRQQNPCVQTEVCTAKRLQYRWEPVTVSYAQLSKSHKGCKEEQSAASPPKDDRPVRRAENNSH